MSNKHYPLSQQNETTWLSLVYVLKEKYTAKNFNCNSTSTKQALFVNSRYIYPIAQSKPSLSNRVVAAACWYPVFFPQKIRIRAFASREKDIAWLLRLPDFRLNGRKYWTRSERRLSLACALARLVSRVGWGTGVAADL